MGYYTKTDHYLPSALMAILGILLQKRGSWRETVLEALFAQELEKAVMSRALVGLENIWVCPI